MSKSNYNEQSTDNKNELFWEVDSNNNPIGSVTRYECHNETRKPWHRSVHIYLFNTKGNIYFTKRGLRKDTAAGLWTVSAAGHVKYGDSSKTTAERELMEELNIKTRLSQIDILKIDYGTEREIIEIFTGVADSTPRINPDEVEQLKLYRFKDICAKFLSGEFDLSGGSRDTFKHVLQTETLKNYIADYLSNRLK